MTVSDASLLLQFTCMHKGKTFVHLSEAERSKIEVLLQQGLSLSSIARALSRPVSTVSREVKRNKTSKLYKAAPAQELTQRRHRLKQKHTVFDGEMKAFIQEQLLTSRLSPELISVAGKRLRAAFISHEWIYQWIWRMKFSQRREDRPYQGLFKHLRHACRKRARGNKRSKRGNILQRRWIDERPRGANQRARTGDLECDIMLGRDRRPGLLVALDRRSRKAWIRKLKTKDAAYVVGLIKGICKQSPFGVRTITFDNDQSFARHYELHHLGIETFFTHPYSSQEKGSVENRIGLIRMFFSKKTDFSKVSYAEVKKVENLINNRPLRMFEYQTPNQLYEKS